MKSNIRIKTASDEMDTIDENLVGVWGCKLIFM